MLYPTATTPLLNELRGGSFTGLSRAEFKEQYPDIWKQREADKLDFRFPGEGGESYMDVIQRVRPIIVELERQPRRSATAATATYCNVITCKQLLRAQRYHQAHYRLAALRYGQPFSVACNGKGEHSAAHSPNEHTVYGCNALSSALVHASVCMYLLLVSGYSCPLPRLAHGRMPALFSNILAHSTAAAAQPFACLSIQ
eukprot:10916-Heterococcus_DN1.PRE.1